MSFWNITSIKVARGYNLFHKIRIYGGSIALISDNFHIFLLHFRLTSLKTLLISLFSFSNISIKKSLFLLWAFTVRTRFVLFPLLLFLFMLKLSFPFLVGFALKPLYAYDMTLITLILRILIFFRLLWRFTPPIFRCPGLWITS